MKKESKNPAPKSTKILVAEDSITQAAQIKHLLESQNYKVVEAKNGKQALLMLEKSKPAMVISDIVMPEMDGFELCKKIKSNKNTEDIPVILLTVLSDSEEIIKGLSSGADGFITKPYNEEYLISQIEKSISEATGEYHEKTCFSTQILFKGKKRFVQAKQQNVLKLMINIYEGAIQQNKKLLQTQEELRLLNEKLETIVEERTADLKEEIELSNQIAGRLKEGEEKYRRLFENVHDLFYETSMDGTIIEVSPSIKSLSKGQYSRDELIGKSMNDFYADPKQRISLLDILRKQGFVSDYEITLKNRDGTKIPCSISAKIIFDSAGRPERINGTMRDITERKIAEEVIDNERRLLRTLIDNLPDQIYVKDSDCRKIIANKADVGNIGFMEEAEVIGKTDIELFPGLIGERGYDDDKKVITSGKAILDREEDFIDIKGVRRWLLTSKIPLHDKNGKIIGLVGIGHDITQRKRANEELIEAKEKAEENDRLKTAFLHNISHEIRTPMNAIVGFSALLGEPGIDRETQNEYVGNITNSSNHLLSIISDILEISNIEANIIRVTKQEVRLNTICKTLYDQFLLKAQEKKLILNIKTGLPDENSFIYSDPTRITQIITNLLTNAIKFTSEGEVDFGYNVKDKMIGFFVSDTGIGIPDEYHERIFDRFYQIEDPSTKFYEGTGLGLALSKAYVEMLGGEIRVSSVPGQGSTFSFTIPYDKLVKEIEQREAIKEPDIVFTRQKKILVAEDIESNFKLINFFLTGINTEVIRASNGKEAVDIARRNRNLDLILMDIKMPEMDGYTASKIIHESRPEIPIIAQTAYVDDKSRAIEAGCSGFITKPFDRKKLLSVIAEYLQ